MYPAEGREDGRTCSRSLLVVFQVFSSFDTFLPLVSRRVVYCDGFQYFFSYDQIIGRAAAPSTPILQYF